MDSKSSIFFLLKAATNTNFATDLKTIAGQLGTYVDSGLNISLEKDSILISYPDTDFHSTLTIQKAKNLADVSYPDRMVLKSMHGDNISLNMVRGIVGGLGYRIYNPSIESFTPTDPNFIDLSTNDIDKQIHAIFNKKQLTPYFQYRNSIIYIAQNRKDGSIHLVNRHLLHDAIENKLDIKKAKYFSVKVAEDFPTFVALSDRALIPKNFYTALHQPERPTLHINHSGFSIESLESDIYISPIFFKLDRKKQQFVPLNHPRANSTFHLIQKGESLIKTVTRLTSKPKLGNLIAAKYPLDIEFQIKDKKIIPRLNISLFIDPHNG